MSDITRSGVEPHHNEAMFGTLAAAVVRQATTFVGICDADFRPCFVNAIGRAMVGLAADADLSGYAITDFFTVEHRPIIENVGLPAILRDGHWNGELRFRHFTDQTLETEVRWSAFALRDEAGKLIGTATFTNEISARKQAERELGDQQMLLTSLLDNLPLGVGVYDRQGDLVHSNQRLRDYVGLGQLPSRQEATASRWRAYDDDSQLLEPTSYPGARALRGERVVPGIDFLYSPTHGAERWLRISAVPLQRDGGAASEAIVVVQDVDDLKRATERIELAGAVLASLGKSFANLDYPAELADELNGHLDRIFSDGVIVEDEVFFTSPTGYEAYFSFRWGPVRCDDDLVELVVGVSRDTSERRAFEQELRKTEGRLRAAIDLVGLGIYSWDPATGALEWDERLRAMWGLPPGAEVDMSVYEGGIHPDDLPHVRDAILACVDPAGDGHYSIEYRVIGRSDGVTRHIATSGRTTFEHGRAVDFIGAAIDVTGRRQAEASIRASEAQFRSFAEHSSNLIWIGDPVAGTIVYRSAAYERIWGQSRDEAATDLSKWMKDVHPDDRQQVEHALASAKAGEVAQCEYRIIRPGDGSMRWLRDTSFPIPDETGAVTRIGGITQDLTQEEVHHVYVVSARPTEARRLAAAVRALGYRVRTFDSGSTFLDMAPVLASGCVLVDLRKAREEGLSIPRELKAQSLALPTIAFDAPGASTAAVVAVMKAGMVDYVVASDGEALRATLLAAMAECRGAMRPPTTDKTGNARVARLTPREREVLVGLVNGGTNKSIGRDLGISPRTVELHRAQVMHRLNASNLTELLQIAIGAGMSPSTSEGRAPIKDT